ncbi:MAG: indole-3-glycerol phosphate synthase TrpC [Balneolaceae bacterium]
MSSILEQIVEKTREDLSRRKREVTFRDLESLEQYEKTRLGFADALRGEEISIIAEVKKASPSKGVIREDFDPLKIAAGYLDGGASAISVLTDVPFFQGDLKYLNEISKEVPIPLLRKDFIVEPYQVKEARAYGADAVLLIATVTSGSQLEELLHASREFGLDALVECYSLEEVEMLNWSLVGLFGVNNRDLNTFEVDLHRGVELLNLSPEKTVRVSESGLSSPKDLLLLHRNGIQAALIGEYFMRQPSPEDAVKRLLDGYRGLLETEDAQAG